jgi:hypothetical protein
MAKSILIKDVYDNLSLFTEGLNDVVKITTKLYYANGAMVIVTFGSLPTLTYYNCRFLISSDLLLNPTNFYAQQYVAYVHLSESIIKTNGDTLLIPAPPAGCKILITNIYWYFNWGTIAYTNSNSGGLYHKHGAGNAGTALITYTQFKASVKSQNSLLLNSTYINQNYSDSLPVYLNINCSNISGDSTIDFYAFYQFIKI